MNEEQVKQAEAAVDEPGVQARHKRADLLGWGMMTVLGVTFLGVLAYKVNHASERDKVGNAILETYMVQHRCVRLERPVQNKPQMIKCADGETTEYLLRKKVIGDAWL